MTKCARRLGVTAAIAVPLVTIGLLQANPAHAGECSMGGTLCGQVMNQSERTIYIAPGWPTKSEDKLETEWLDGIEARKLGPGEHSTTIMKDADAFRAPDACVTTYSVYNGLRGNSSTYGKENRKGKGPIWIKISNGDVATVKVHC